MRIVFRAGASTSAIVLLSSMLLVIIIAESLGVFTPINNFVEERVSTGHNAVASAISETCGLAPMIIIISSILVNDYMSYRRIRYDTISMLIALVIGLVLVDVLKLLLQVPRPIPRASYEENILLKADQYSFPSGHTLRATILAYYFGDWFKKLRIVFWLWAFLVALSRIILGQHWFSDVLASIILAIWVSLLAKQVVRSIIVKRKNDLSRQ